MFQRKQSLFIIAAIVSMLVTLFVDLGSAEGKVLNVWHITGEIEDNFMATLGSYLALITSLLMIGTLLTFKNRKQQMMLANISMILAYVFAGFEIFLVNKYGLDFSLWLILPVEAGFLMSMSRKLIKKDDDLVKSVDRIR